MNNDSRLLNAKIWVGFDMRHLLARAHWNPQNSEKGASFSPFADEETPTEKPSLAQTQQDEQQPESLPCPYPS